MKKFLGYAIVIGMYSMIIIKILLKLGIFEF